MNGTSNRARKDLSKTIERVRKVRADAQAKWSDARRAFREAQKMRELVDLQVAQLTRDPAFHSRYREAMLKKILVSAIAEAHAEMGYIQCLDPRTGQMVMEAHQGLDAAFVERFKSVDLLHPLCGSAVSNGCRVIVAETSSNRMFAGNENLESLLDARIRALQITPIFGKGRRVLGLLATLWSTPRVPNVKELRMTDYYARSAAPLLETDQDVAQAFQA